LRAKDTRLKNGKSSLLAGKKRKTKGAEIKQAQAWANPWCAA